MSRRSDLIAAWKTLLETTGYAVGYGERPPSPDESEPTREIIFRLSSVVTRHGLKKSHESTVRIAAVVDIDHVDQPGEATGEMVDAIKAAVETDDATVGGWPIDPVEESEYERAPGSRYGGVEILYRQKWSETWGHP